MIKEYNPSMQKINVSIVDCGYMFRLYKLNTSDCVP